VAPFAEVAISLPRNLSLPQTHGFDFNSRCAKEVIKAVACDRILSAFDDDRSLYVADRRDPTYRRAFDRSGILRRIRFGTEYGDNRG
jgi:hypothetical protein